MRQVTVGKMWMLAFLMAGLVAGCGREQTPSSTVPGGPGGPAIVSAVPTVISTDPLNGAINVSLNQKIIATFNQAMTSATVIAPGTFTWQWRV